MMCLCRPTPNPWAVRWLKAPENAEVSVKKVSPPSIVMPAVKIALPPNCVAVTAKMVKPPGRLAVITIGANTPERAMGTQGSHPNMMVDTVRARINGTIGHSDGINGAKGNPAR